MPKKEIGQKIASKDYQGLMAKDELYMHGMRNN